MNRFKIYLIALGACLLIGCAKDVRREPISTAHNLIPAHITSLLKEKNQVAINERGLIIFSLYKNSEDLKAYVKSFEEIYAKKYHKKIMIILPNQKYISDSEKAHYAWFETPLTNQLYLKERLDQLRVCTTTCADGIGIYNLKHYTIEEGYNRLLLPDELIQRLTL